MTLMRIRVYYVICPNITKNFAFFDDIATGSTASSLVSQTGRCVEHATKKTEPTFICQNDGQWYEEPRGECVCKPGYEGNAEGTQCTGTPMMLLMIVLS